MNLKSILTVALLSLFVINAQITPCSAQDLSALTKILQEEYAQAPEARNTCSDPNVRAIFQALTDKPLADQPAPSDFSRITGFGNIKDSSWYSDATLGTSGYYVMRLDFTHTTYIDDDDRTWLRFYDDDGHPGGCWHGYDYTSNPFEYSSAVVIQEGSVYAVGYDFDIVGNTIDGVFHILDIYDDIYGPYPLTGVKKEKIDCAGGGTDTEDNVYYAPFVPKDSDFLIGFGLSNAGNAAQAEATIEYFNNGGTKVGQQSASIVGNGQFAVMKNVSTTESGWAKITANHPIYGIALVFGHGTQPMFDMDVQTKGETSLTINNIATAGGWTSTAMLANTTGSTAQVTITFYPDNGGATDTRSFPIAGNGCTQFDLSTFSGGGSAIINSSQPLVGFLLYNGLNAGTSYLGGLSIVPTID